MSFKYTQLEKNKIVFTPVNGGCSQAFVIAIGVLFFSIGCCILYFSKSQEMPFVLFKYLFPSMGILAIWAGIQLPKIAKKSMPSQIIFDNTNGRVEIYQTHSEVKNAFIYYDEIEGFTIVRHRRSSSSNRVTKISYTYHVCLLKKTLAHGNC
jgi:hypothetical protein